MISIFTRGTNIYKGIENTNIYIYHETQKYSTFVIVVLGTRQHNFP